MAITCNRSQSQKKKKSNYGVKSVDAGARGLNAESANI